MSLRHDYDASPMWSLTGLAIRNGRRMGLDYPSPMHSPLERQERQWVWFNLLYVDAYIAEVGGVREPWIEFRDFGDFETPLNLNDRDLHRETNELPEDIEGPTDVMFTRMRVDWVHAARKARLPHMRCAYKFDEADPDSEVIQMQAIDDLDDLFARRYVRHCDPTTPMHLLLLLTAKCMVLNLRISAQRQRRERLMQAGLDASHESDSIFDLCLKVLDHSFMIQSTESLQRFRWHLQDQLPRPAAVFVVGELRTRTTGADADRGWMLVEKCFSQHPDIVDHSQRPWIWQLGSLVLEAWGNRENARREQLLPPVVAPEFIVALCEMRNRRLSNGTVNAAQEQTEAEALPSDVWHSSTEHPWIGAGFSFANVSSHAF